MIWNYCRNYIFPGLISLRNPEEKWSMGSKISSDWTQIPVEFGSNAGETIFRIETVTCALLSTIQAPNLTKNTILCQLSNDFTCFYALSVRFSTQTSVLERTGRRKFQKHKKNKKRGAAHLSEKAGWANGASTLFHSSVSFFGQNESSWFFIKLHQGVWRVEKDQNQPKTPFQTVAEAGRTLYRRKSNIS